MTVCAFVLMLFLTGCGFQPMLQSSPDDQAYGADTQNVGSRISLKAKDKTNPSATTLHMFRIKLKQNMTRHTPNPKYRYRITLEEQSGDIGYGLDATAIRAQRQLIARIAVLDEAYTVIEEKTADAISSFTQTENDSFSNVQAQQAAAVRLVDTLAWDVARIIMGRDNQGK